MISMVEFVFLAKIVVIAVAALTLVYRLLPYRDLADTKPMIAFFPKYRLDISAVKDIELNLVQAGFHAIGSDRPDWYRGRNFGDFSVKLTKLRLRISEDRQSAVLATPFMGIVFDAGDLWTVGKQIVDGD